MSYAATIILLGRSEAEDQSEGSVNFRHEAVGELADQAVEVATVDRRNLMG